LKTVTFVVDAAVTVDEVACADVRDASTKTPAQRARTRYFMTSI
jgi:hypothetical protein